MTDRYETIFLREDNKDSYTDLALTNGSIIVETNASLPKLREIGGDIYINKDCTFETASLDSVGGNIRQEDNTVFKADNLVALGGGVYIGENTVANLNKLECIGTYVKVTGNVTFPSLRSIGTYLHIGRKGNIKVDKLEYVGDYVHADTNVDLNSVLEVGGEIFVNTGVTLNMKGLKFTGGKAHCYNNSKLNTKDVIYGDRNVKTNMVQKNFEIFNELGYLFSDTILAKVLRHKKTIYKVRLIGEENNSYCLEVEGMFSHGNTLEEAKKGIIYKIKNRDTSDYSLMDLDTELTYEETVKMYRIITGACEKGTKRFVEQNKDRIAAKYAVRDKYTIREIMAFLKGAYGFEILDNFFKDWY